MRCRLSPCHEWWIPDALTEKHCPAWLSRPKNGAVLPKRLSRSRSL